MAHWPELARNAKALGGRLSSSRREVSNKLTAGAKFGLSYALKATKKRDECSVASFDILSVDWSPKALPFPIPKEVVESRRSLTVKSKGAERSHGPLPLLVGPSTLKFLGPNCLVERALFESIVRSFRAA